MKSFALLPCVTVSLWACSTETGGLGAGGLGTGGLGTGGAGGGQNDECYQIAEWTVMTPHADFAACALPPNSSCSRATFCGPSGCGGKDSSFDANGCRRPGCQEDADCGSGQRCYDTGAGNPINAPCAATEYACCPDGDGCYCTAQLDCPTEKHCVDESEL